MRAYIIDYGTSEPLEEERELLSEEIVRCRDCKWFEALSSNGFPVLDKRGKQIIRCNREWFVLPDGNGFCAWGGRNNHED